MFRFRRFEVRHELSAMKVGTDGVLLGAWAWLGDCRSVLDIGCGTGLLSLMVAQRLSGKAGARVCGVELDSAAAREARANVERSEFREMISIEEGDVREMQGRFDCLVCNPPFYSVDIVSPTKRRAMARQCVTLTSEELWHTVGRLSHEDSTFSAIIPYQRLESFDKLAKAQGFSLLRLCRVRTRQGKPVSRAMVTYRKGLPIRVTDEEDLVLLRADGTRTEEYALLTEDFYL